jgi:hypothetical protein
VTDYDSGLQWEQKNGTLCLIGDVHCVNDTYDWNEANAFVQASTNGSTLTCFFGHCDWRLPTSVELQTILLAPFPCGTSPCIDPIFGLTAAAANVGYWSSTTTALGLNDAWFVNFENGGVFDGAKASSKYVRAVRGGL